MKQITALAFALLITGVAHADVPVKQQPEVAHLLDFVQSSPCAINRNGTIHQGEEAVVHIQKKYEYFRKKIKTTEQFIEYSANKSTLSGKYYTVLCAGQEPVRTKDWLLQELATYRAKKKKDGPQYASQPR
jgi:hypothetical protein